MFQFHDPGCRKKEFLALPPAVQSPLEMGSLCPHSHWDGPVLATPLSDTGTSFLKESQRRSAPGGVAGKLGLQVSLTSAAQSAASHESSAQAPQSLALPHSCEQTTGDLRGSAAVGLGCAFTEWGPNYYICELKARLRRPAGSL